jgi:hypothetical protein
LPNSINYSFLLGKVDAFFFEVIIFHQGLF